MNWDLKETLRQVSTQVESEAAIRFVEGGRPVDWERIVAGTRSQDNKSAFKKQKVTRPSSHRKPHSGGQKMTAWGTASRKWHLGSHQL